MKIRSISESILASGPWHLFFFLYFLFPTAEANLIQILHTNDIHSHFEHSVHKPDLGGYPRLLSIIEKEKEKAKAEGIESLVMDGGDFLEGHLFYLADKGKKTYSIHGHMGYDVVVLGNHDYLMGLPDLESMLSTSNVKFDLIAANFSADKRYTNVNKKIQPYTERVIAGIKVGIVGATDASGLYKWRLDGGDVTNDIKAVRKWAKVLRKRGNDLIIALTHIGLTQDLLLARSVGEIDLIVGGHSHTALHNVVWMKSKNGKNIPIVQAGKHAEWLGKLLIDYDLNQKKLKVVDYRLLPVQKAVSDQKILELIHLAKIDLDSLFGTSWLSEVVGQSKLRPQHLGGDQDVWMYFINDAMIDAVGSDVSLHAGALSGSNYPITGPVTRADLYNSSPRHFELERLKGYDVYTASVRGLWIQLTVKIVMKLGLPLYFSGLTFDYKVTSESASGKKKYELKNMRIKGEEIKPFQRYKVSLSEAIVRGSQGMSPLFRFILEFPENWKIPMWTALESKLRKIGTITEDYRGSNFRMKVPDPSAVKK